MDPSLSASKNEKSTAVCCVLRGSSSRLTSKRNSSEQTLPSLFVSALLQDLATMFAKLSKVKPTLSRHLRDSANRSMRSMKVPRFTTPSPSIPRYAKRRWCVSLHEPKPSRWCKYETNTRRLSFEIEPWPSRSMELKRSPKLVGEPSLCRRCQKRVPRLDASRAPERARASSLARPPPARLLTLPRPRIFSTARRFVAIVLARRQLMCRSIS
mmetsp:Transcript_79323/g.224349  ORF Transcript_79323/g.224349 Transcript_79323/m.224349 type:complete len:212 (-) Transcript_79323:543-1178(-)